MGREGRWPQDQWRIVAATGEERLRSPRECRCERQVRQTRCATWRKTTTTRRSRMMMRPPDALQEAPTSSSSQGVGRGVCVRKR